ncbi:MAG: histidine phosphatase family protein [Spirochaetota bacterium]|nr:MAG: histidine phosphatase family protein [Spirochaetota bacterium]
MIQDVIPESFTEKRPLTIIIRHAEREQFILGSNNDPLLTQRGHEDAFRFGQEMKTLTPVSVYHSFIRRCQQTAYELCRGITDQNGSCKIVGETVELGPALFVVNREGVLTSFQKHDSAFLRLWFDGKLSEDLIVPLDGAARKCLDLLINQLSGKEITTVNISHDWNIMLVLEYYFQLRHENIGYPDFLTGIAAYRDNNTLHLQYGQHRCTLELPLV